MAKIVSSCISIGSKVVFWRLDTMDLKIVPPCFMIDPHCFWKHKENYLCNFKKQMYLALAHCVRSDDTPLIENIHDIQNIVGTIFFVFVSVNPNPLSLHDEQQIKPHLLKCLILSDFFSIIFMFFWILNHT